MIEYEYMRLTKFLFVFLLITSISKMFKTDQIKKITDLKESVLST